MKTLEALLLAAQLSLQQMTKSREKGKVGKFAAMQMRGTIACCELRILKTLIEYHNNPDGNTTTINSEVREIMDRNIYTDLR